MNVDRRTKQGLINENEPNQCQIYITSAGTRNSYAYMRLIELFEDSIIHPKNTFVWGVDYRVPLMHGLLNKTYLNEIKMSASFKDESFAREYMSKWTGGGADSWFDYDRLSKYRKLVNPEKSQKLINGCEIFYIISTDVGRITCQTVVTVHKVFVHDDCFSVNLVNIYILGKDEQSKHFSRQAMDLKALIEAYDAREVVIDANGLIASPLVA